MSLLTSKRAIEQRKNATAAAAAQAEAERRAAGAEAARRVSVSALESALAPLAGAVALDEQRAAVASARQRLDDLRHAARRAEALLDEDVADHADVARVAKRRQRLETLRADVAGAEAAASEAETALRVAALGQLRALRDAGLRAASAEGLEQLVDDESKEAAQLHAKLVALAARATEKVRRQREHVETARAATHALTDLGELGRDAFGRVDVGALRELGDQDALRAVQRAVFNKLRAGEPRDAFEWVCTLDYGRRTPSRASPSRRPAPPSARRRRMSAAAACDRTPAD